MWALKARKQFFAAIRPNIKLRFKVRERPVEGDEHYLRVVPATIASQSKHKHRLQDVRAGTI